MRFPVSIVAALTCLSAVSLASAAIPPGYLGAPFCCDTLQRHYQEIPGKLVMVFFDSGGEGVGFHYPGGCGDAGTTMRLNAAKQQIAADVPVCMQPFSGYDFIYKSNPGVHDTGYWHLAWIDSNGQWMKFSVHVKTAGMYHVTFHEANAYLPNLQVLTYYDGTHVKSDSIFNMPVDTPIPSGCIEVWHSWTITHDVDSVMLDTGLQVIQFTFLLGSWNLDWLSFDLQYPSSTVLAPAFHPTEPDLMTVTPMENALNVYLDLKLSGKTSFSILDCRGKLVGNSLTRTLASGPQSQRLPFGELRPGVYFLEMEHNGIMAESRFTIAK